ncbi:zinc transporter ZIP2-like [Phacochoerus africanus]|uniref:zinc transporter ZIP2-like n=1 Tax=Phacochoerus africanus TaxID=41426 RepID=UPI001FDAC7C0|nr:zinc transporter ZIP2-like [Phacochoerus africanus]
MVECMTLGEPCDLEMALAIRLYVDCVMSPCSCPPSTPPERAQGSDQEIEPLLRVKIGCLFALLVLSLVCGLIPTCFRWSQAETVTGRHRRILSLLGCTSAGVFLGAGFMHVIAEALEGNESEIQRLVIQCGSPSGLDMVKVS